MRVDMVRLRKPLLQICAYLGRNVKLVKSMEPGGSVALVNVDGREALCVIEHVETSAGRVPRVTTHWTWRDRVGAYAVRWGAGRGRYRVAPGLYAIGRPTADSPLLATANYKLTFDVVRRALAGADVWLLVLDTSGVNVWCAAGKGTFGTAELVRRLESSGAKQVVKHRRIILPQLGAPGVAAHEVQRLSGFRVVYGPVRIGDLPACLGDGRRVTDAMRQVTFTLRERLAVVPIEAVTRFGPALLVMLVLFAGAGVGRVGYRLATEQWPGIALAVWLNVLAGVALVPALLPFLPGRAFALKGGAMGLATAAALWAVARYPAGEGIAVGLLSVASCSFLGLMFTGCTPYTSVSGVRREMRWAVPLQVACGAAGLVLWFVMRWS